ncbi:hypothetical protein [Roseateles sp. P5_E1]
MLRQLGAAKHSKTTQPSTACARSGASSATLMPSVSKAVSGFAKL